VRQIAFFDTEKMYTLSLVTEDKHGAKFYILLTMHHVIILGK